MELFAWDNKYSVDIESIDNDHKGLIDLINKLFEAMRAGKAKDVLDGTLTKLISYTRTHFLREETYFRTTNYPGYEEHKDQHELFIQKVNELKKHLDQGDSKISIDLMKFLSDWLINHILVSDRKYAQHLKKFGIR